MILNILQLHPCYLLNMYFSGHFGTGQMLDYFKILHPVATVAN